MFKVDQGWETSVAKNEHTLNKEGGNGSAGASEQSRVLCCFLKINIYNIPIVEEFKTSMVLSQNWEGHNNPMKAVSLGQHF